MTRQLRRQTKRRRAFRAAMEGVNEEYGFFTKDGQVSFNLPRRARRRIAWRRAKHFVREQAA